MFGNLGSLLGGNLTDVSAIMESVASYVTIITTGIYSVAAAICLGYAIMIGLQFMRAEDDAKRKEAKQRLIYAIVGVVGAVLVAVLVGVVMPATGPTSTKIEGADKLSQAMQKTLNMVDSIVKVVLQIVTSLAGVFALYLAYKFISAEDDAKRKDAKKQLLYAVIGIVAIVVVNQVATAVIGVIKG